MPSLKQHGGALGRLDFRIACRIEVQFHSHHCSAACVRNRFQQTTAQHSKNRQETVLSAPHRQRNRAISSREQGTLASSMSRSASGNGSLELRTCSTRRSRASQDATRMGCN